MITRKLHKFLTAVNLRNRIWFQIRALLFEEAWRKANGPFLPQETLEEVLGRAPGLRLVRPDFQDGNVSPTELMLIAALVSKCQPRLCLEIGTFNGNTTLQIAANLTEGGRVITLDLPLENAAVPEEVELADQSFIKSAARAQRRFKGTEFSNQIDEVFGDSKTFDFGGALSGRRIDFAFIDGSHSYEYVKNDTERLFPLLNQRAIVVWHDYCRSWPGVIKYLNELGCSLPLRHIQGTTVVYSEFRNA